MAGGLLVSRINGSFVTISGPAAIGIIIMAKQIHVMLGVKPDAQSLFATIGAIPASLRDMNPEVAIIDALGC